MNANEIIGYYILASEKATADKPIYNPQYVEKVGIYVSRLKLLKYRVADEKRRAYLLECYQNHLFSAMFWAVYPKDISSLTPSEKKRLKANLNNCHKKEQTN